MQCPKCNSDMEFEEVKNFSGDWYCTECEYETSGICIPCGSDGISITDHVELIDK